MRQEMTSAITGLEIDDDMLQGSLLRPYDRVYPNLAVQDDEYEEKYYVRPSTDVDNRPNGDTPSLARDIEDMEKQLDKDLKMDAKRTVTYQDWIECNRLRLANIQVHNAFIDPVLLYMKPTPVSSVALHIPSVATPRQQPVAPVDSLALLLTALAH